MAGQRDAPIQFMLAIRSGASARALHGFFNEKAEMPPHFQKVVRRREDRRRCSGPSAYPL